MTALDIQLKSVLDNHCFLMLREGFAPCRQGLFRSTCSTHGTYRNGRPYTIWADFRHFWTPHSSNSNSNCFCDPESPEFTDIIPLKKKNNLTENIENIQVGRFNNILRIPSSLCILIYYMHNILYATILRQKKQGKCILPSQHSNYPPFGWMGIYKLPTNASKLKI